MPSKRQTKKDLKTLHNLNAANTVKLNQSRKIMKVLAWVSILFFIFIIFLCGIIGFKKVFLTSNRQFLMKNLNIQPKEFVNEPSLIKLSSEINGTNLFNINPGNIRHQLEIEPAINRVEVKRILPNTLNIKIFAKEAVARIISEEILYLIDLNGFVFLPKKHSEKQTNKLPIIIDTIDEFKLIPGSKIQSQSIKSTLFVLTYRQENPQANKWFEIEKIILNDKNNLKLKLKGAPYKFIRKGAFIKLPIENTKLGIDKACKVLEERFKNGQPTKSLDATLKNVIVRP